jgi:hypothetical protein
MLVVNFQNEKPIPYCSAYIPWMGLPSSRRALQAITFHKRDGVVLRAIDPIERDRDG